MLLKRIGSFFTSKTARIQDALYDLDLTKKRPSWNAGVDLDVLAHLDKSKLSERGLLTPSYERLDYLNLRKSIEVSLKAKHAEKHGLDGHRFFHMPTDFSVDGVGYVNESNAKWDGKKETVDTFVDIVEPKRILDLGIADGWLEEGWTERGIHTLAVEGTTYHYHNTLLRIQALKLDVELIYGELEDEFLWTIIDQYPDFDLCYMGDIIEHLVDPAAVLARVSKKCSAIIVATPPCRRTAKLETRTSGDHIWEYDEAGLQEQLEAAGYGSFVSKDEVAGLMYVLGRK